VWTPGLRNEFRTWLREQWGLSSDEALAYSRTCHILLRRILPPLSPSGVDKATLTALLRSRKQACHSVMRAGGKGAKAFKPLQHFLGLAPAAPGSDRSPHGSPTLPPAAPHEPPAGWTDTIARAYRHWLQVRGRRRRIRRRRRMTTILMAVVVVVMMMIMTILMAVVGGIDSPAPPPPIDTGPPRQLPLQQTRLIPSPSAHPQIAPNGRP
jgi:hypothetical protein